MTTLHINQELMQRIDSVEFAYSKERMTAASEVSGDTKLVSFVEVNPLLSLMAPTIPNPYFNRILISLSADDSKLSSLLDDFTEKSASPMIDISPGAMTTTCSKMLLSKGFSQTDFHPIFVRRLEGWNSEVASVQTRIVSTPNDLKSFQDLYVQGWEASAGFSDTMKKFIEKWNSYSGWYLLLAFDDGVPISTAVLFVYDKAAYLADATTPPFFRGRGGQSSLLTARIQKAKELGCDVIFSRADFGSTSHKNMERAGLPLSYTRAVWERVTK